MGMFNAHDSESGNRFSDKIMRADELQPTITR
jgi:hypothetical protein